MGSDLTRALTWVAMGAAGMAVAWGVDGWATRPVIAAGFAVGFVVGATMVSWRR